MPNAYTRPDTRLDEQAVCQPVLAIGWHCFTMPTHTAWGLGVCSSRVRGWGKSIPSMLDTRLGQAVCHPVAQGKPSFLRILLWKLLCNPIPSLSKSNPEPPRCCITILTPFKHTKHNTHQPNTSQHTQTQPNTTHHHNTTSWAPPTSIPTRKTLLIHTTTQPILPTTLTNPRSQPRVHYSLSSSSISAQQQHNNNTHNTAHTTYLT